jgi:hypothetical protein
VDDCRVEEDEVLAGRPGVSVVGDEVCEDAAHALLDGRVVSLEVLLLDAHDDLHESVFVALVDKAVAVLAEVLVFSQVDHQLGRIDDLRRALPMLMKTCARLRR